MEICNFIFIKVDKKYKKQSKFWTLLNIFYKKILILDIMTGIEVAGHIFECMVI